MELAAAPSNDALRPGMARALDGRNGRIKEAARDGGSRALHAVASHGRMPLCVYLLEKHVQRKCQRTFGHSFFLFSQQVKKTGLKRKLKNGSIIGAMNNHESSRIFPFFFLLKKNLRQPEGLVMESCYTRQFMHDVCTTRQSSRPCMQQTAAQR
uniref:Uncharacterized protein n=1 Tax=Aegilops tauschii subsp. strangulata TaxID=200361 RepID=A0A453EVQ2_AEGTS